VSLSKRYNVADRIYYVRPEKKREAQKSMDISADFRKRKKEKKQKDRATRPSPAYCEGRGGERYFLLGVRREGSRKGSALCDEGIIGTSPFRNGRGGG